MPPKKGQKMSLNDFLADESTGKTSWADEMDDLPIASAPRDNSYRRGGDYLASMPDRVDRDRGFERPERSYPPRDELPLPDKPPFTAFVGNLSFDVVDADVEDFFAPSQLVSVRIVTGHDGKPKGFGYVEFQSQDDLRAALDRSGSQLATRTVRISVAEPPKSGFGGDRAMHSSQADDASQWRRAAPLPPSEPRARKPASGSSSPAPQPAAAERKKLDLKPRSAEATAASASASATSSKPSPFGNAKPIDAAERERQIDEKLAQREKERQEDLKAKKEKAKADKEKKDKAPAPTSTDKPQADSAQADASTPAAASQESAPSAAAKAPRAPAPVGAWGGGRKPSGALVGGEQSPAAANDDKSADIQVDEVAQKVEETKLDA
ncbi:FOG: RRM domain [Moesziomyces antarcticus T-34]|uniref:FOG: RRM domain n=1 Tax=Pseudozyma antarctica (strain T-34) TaxID=1151754 RepID=M9M6B1_PSEA3|nr:FOG: RRM domain [Moesziomyces antarcticus T-34]